MPLLDIGGTTVNFPYTPYECQLAYLEKVLQCLKTNSNGILESPTGTGKTLCLLCSTLAWLQDRKAQTELNRQANLASLVVDGGTLNKQQLDSLSRNIQQSTGVTWGGSEFVVPKIIYASRTHSQLSQAVQELKRTAYNNMKVSVIGSRDQLCIHEQVRKEKNNSNKIHMCRAKVAARTCHYYNRYEDIKRNSEIRSLMGDVVDIEDIVTYGEKQRVCPYYMTRELKSDADIIFMPYNYLLDPKMRMNQGIEIQGNVLIFDEAHNLERICEDSSSFELTPGDLATAMEELTKLAQKMLEMAKNEDQSLVEDTESGSMPEPEFTLEDVIKLKSTLVDLEKEIDEIEVLNTDKGLTKPGVFIFELFNKVHIGFESKNYLIDLFEKMISFVSTDAAGVTVLSKGSGLTKIVDVIKIIFSRDFNGTSMNVHQEALSKSYKVHIQPAPQNNQKKKMDTWTTSSKPTKSGKTLCYWCFSPGHRMLDLVSCGVKCIILTSGTLSPLKSFTAEMQIEFPITLENPHVIEKHQIFVGSMGKGPDNTVLNSNYETRFKESYQSSLGKAVVNFSRIVPKGLLIFFPSYPVMEKCIENWQSNGIYNSISQYKAIYVEPRGKGLLDDVMDEFYDKINNPALNGAIFAAVCRGKVSEGLDFSDDNGRAVIITGLPYPPRMDPKVNLKMQFLDEMRNKNKFKSLTGQEWYRQQASRAVNQAIGRVIRHRQDFGAILLCDTRFSAASAVSQLPLWVKPHVKNYDMFGKIIKDVIVFFKTTELKMPAVAPRAKIRGHSTTPAASHFMPTMSRVSATTSTKARNVTDHVPSLKAEEVSVEKLRTQYNGGSAISFSTGAKTGLLEALSSSKSDRYQDSTDGYSLSKTSDMKKMPGRKKIIVKKKDDSSEVVMSKQFENVTTVKKNLKTAEEYIQEIKKRLSKEQYKEFSTALVSYKSSGDFGKFATLLVRLFTRKEEDFNVLRQFYRFIRPKDKERFNELCRDLTGSSCGYKPEDGISRKRVLTDTENIGSSSDQIQPEKRLRGITENVEVNTCTKSDCTVNVLGSTCTVTQTESLKNCDTLQNTSVTVNDNDGPSSQKLHENRDPSTRPAEDTDCICCKCRNPAKVPFRAQCGHICCFKCWREVFDTNKLCPECDVRVKRRQMIQLLYS